MHRPHSSTNIYERCGVADRRLQQAMMNLARIRKLLPDVLRVDVVVSGEIETVKESGTTQKQPQSSNGSTRISVPENRIKDLLAAAQN